MTTTRRLLWALAALLVAGSLASTIGVTAAPAETVFRLWMVGDARTLDPAVAADFPSGSSALLMHLRLVASDATGKVSPMGALSWTVTGGGLVYTFDLDPRAKSTAGNRSRPPTGSGPWTASPSLRPAAAPPSRSLGASWVSRPCGAARRDRLRASAS